MYKSYKLRCGDELSWTYIAHDFITKSSIYDLPPHKLGSSNSLDKLQVG